MIVGFPKNPFTVGARNLGRVYHPLAKALTGRTNKTVQLAS
jgi:hypothetical protein